MTGSLLDTNIIIRFLNGDEKVHDTVASLNDIYIPITTVGELMFGAENSAKKEQNRIIYEYFCSSYPIINVNFPIAQQYGKIAAHLRKNGTPIPMNDMWIAATAIANNLRLVTADAHFKNIPDLDLLLV